MQTPSQLGLPYPDWRPGQRLALRTVLSARTPHVVINAPTGSGKSVIAAALSQLQPEKRHVTLTATKALQDQYQEFPFLVDLKGASNYPCRAATAEFADWFPITHRKSIRCDDGPCHLGYPCALKDVGCDYFDARRSFVAASAGTTNYAAWLANRRVGSGLGVADRLVCDEAHALPEQLMSACRIDIPHALVDGRVPKGYRGWARWAEERLHHLATEDHSTAKREQLDRGLRMMATMDASWAWDQDDRGYHFEPTIPRLLMPTLQQVEAGERSRVVYLSATIMPSMFDLLDVDQANITFHTMRSTFPVENRPIYFAPGARADFRSMKHEWQQERFIDAIDVLCEAREDRRGLIHSVSFARAEHIYHNSSQHGRMILHHKGESAAHAVMRYLNGPDNAVLVSPSIMTGFDFKYGKAEFQILPKLPFPNTQSNIMRARIRNTPRYWDHLTMQLFVQACGRIVRAWDDRGETFVTDTNVEWWYRANRDLAPDWFDDAIIRTRRRITPLQKLAA